MAIIKIIDNQWRCILNMKCGGNEYRVVCRAANPSNRRKHIMPSR